MRRSPQSTSSQFFRSAARQSTSIFFSLRPFPGLCAWQTTNYVVKSLPAVVTRAVYVTHDASVTTLKKTIQRHPPLDVPVKTRPRRRRLWRRGRTESLKLRCLQRPHKAWKKRVMTQTSGTETVLPSFDCFADEPLSTTGTIATLGIRTLAAGAGLISCVLDRGVVLDRSVHLGSHQ
jgi:hypothetical protein